MKLKSPIIVNELHFTSLSVKEFEKYKDDFKEIKFDRRTDFLLNSSFATIVVKVEFWNNRYFDENSPGVRRKVSFTLFDETDRATLATFIRKINAPAGFDYHYEYIDFYYTPVEFQNAHNYKIIVKDENTSEVIGEALFNTFDEDVMGDPSEWYKPLYAGIRQDDSELQLYKSLEVEEGKNLFARLYFSISNLVNSNFLFPELEIKLHYPDSPLKKEEFHTPKTWNRYDNKFYVEIPFISCDFHDGVFYVEFLSMKKPIAGFVFSAGMFQRKGTWENETLLPLKKYSYPEARSRFMRLMDEASREENEYESDGQEDEKSDNFDEFLCDFFLKDLANKSKIIKEEDSPKVSIVKALEPFTGLEKVKRKLITYEHLVKFNKMRKEKGLPVNDAPLHAMFLGSPGTGKTSVAKLMGKMLHDAGLLSSGHIVVKERATLMGQNYASEQEKTIEAIEQAQGGILFIDEAYQLYQPKDPRDPGKFVIETLLTTLADTTKNDWMLILAGYPEEMRKMFEMNPGFKSRIPESNLYLFEDFSEEELMTIAENYFQTNCYVLTDEAREALRERLACDYARREKTFGNARHVLNLIQTEILPAMAVRVSTQESTDKTILMNIQASDIPAPLAPRTASIPRVGFRF